MKSEQLFRNESVGKLILKTSIPSVVIIIMMMLYNMADIFFIGQTGDTLQVAAVSLAGPLISILSGLGTLVGAGGCAAIATALGKDDSKLAKSMSSFSGWFALVMGVLFGVGVLTLMPQILSWIGAGSGTFTYAQDYLRIIAIGAPFMIFSSSMANIVRAQGATKESMIGNMLGNIINIILDPIFISVLGFGIAGAAVATVIGNVIAALYFIRFIRGKKSELSMKPRDFSLKRSISLKILSLGLPTAFGVILMSVSTMVRNNVAVGYGDNVIAAIGVADRVAMIVSMVQMGICMGVQPAISYNFGAGLYKRMKAIVKRTAVSTAIIGIALTAAVFIGRTALVNLFISNTDVTQLGQHMVAVTMITGPIFGISLLCSTFLQSTNKAAMATFASLLRQGLFLLPLTFIFNAIFGLEGILWAAVAADILATAINLVLFAKRYRAIKKQPAVDFVMEGAA